MSNDFSKLIQNNAEYLVADAQARADIVEIRRLLPTIENKRVIFTADSYGTWNNGELANKLEQALNLGADNFYDFSYRSMGFSQKGGGGGDPELTALEFFQAHASDVTNPSTITDIIVTLGLNDIAVNYGAVEETNVTAFINYLKSTYPNAKIHYGFIGNENGSTTITTGQIDLYFNMLGVITKTFRDAECTIIEGIEYVMHDALNFDSDWIHPNSNGCTELSNFIAQHMNGLKPKYQKIYTFTYQSSQQCYIIIDGGTTEIRVFNFGTLNVSVPAGSFATLFHLNGSAIRGIHDQNRAVFYPAFLTIGGALTPKFVTIKDSEIQVYSDTAVTVTGAVGFSIVGSTLSF